MEAMDTTLPRHLTVATFLSFDIFAVEKSKASLEICFDVFRDVMTC